MSARPSSTASLTRRIAASTLLALVALCLTAWAAGRPSTTLAQTNPAPGCWTDFTSPVTRPGFHEYRAVSALSPSDVWAVGLQAGQGDGDYDTLAAHWNGQSWSVVSTPNLNDEKNILSGVVALAPDNVWAVGYGSIAFSAPGTPDQSLILHYDGKQWSIVPAPPVEGKGNILSGVSATGPNDVWAVGSYTPSNSAGEQQSLVMHYDGTAWSRQPLPAFPLPTPSATEPPSSSWLTSVAAVGPGDVWAVGSAAAGPILHWDGRAWTQVPIPGARKIIVLWSISALASDDIWAVGQGERDAITVHYDGSSWKEVALPSLQGPANSLHGIAALAPDNVWAVGYYFPDTLPHQLLLMHWDGTAWTRQPLPVTKYLALFNGASVTAGAAGGEFWVVGGFSSDAQDPGSGLLLRHLDTPCAALTAGPVAQGTPQGTPQPTPQTGPTSDCWSPSYAFPGSTSRVFASAILDRNDIWAAGTSLNPSANGQSSGLALHWNGTSWQPTHTVDIGDGSAIFAMSALAPNDVWAAGEWYALAPDRPSGNILNTLVQRWDGSRWNYLPSSNIAGADNSFVTIAAISDNDVWAGGSYSAKGGISRALLEHFDGSKWSIVPAPQVGQLGEYITSIAAVASNDVWAVGKYPSQDVAFRALVLHWDGSKWSAVQTPVTLPSTELRSVWAVSSNDVWAMGTQCCRPGTLTAGLILHWDGTSWKEAQAVNPAPLQAEGIFAFNTVVAISASDVWAVGYTTAPKKSQRVLLEHYDGKKWSIVSAPQDDYTATIIAAREVSGNLVLVGQQAASTSPAGVSMPSVLALYEGGVGCIAPVATPTPAKLLDPPLPMPGTGSVTFPETGKTVSGLFLVYWKNNGGLPQQGYPITNLIGEVSPLNGKLYTMQYFERAVFEYHPENQPPYNVLLSQLGTFQYKQKYPNGAPNQTANNSPGSVYFPQTGHRLGGRFLQYWLQNGDVMQQGYPISDEFTEVSDLNGKPYLVQYFERAVFEYHPENPPPYDVLLSQLGRFRYDSLYGK